MSKLYHFRHAELVDGGSFRALFHRHAQILAIVDREVGGEHFAVVENPIQPRPLGGELGLAVGFCFGVARAVTALKAVIRFEAGDFAFGAFGAGGLISCDFFPIKSLALG